jgi:hypothetical protein
MILKRFNILQAFSSISDGAEDIGVALLMWLVASLSTCLAVVWSVILWFSEYVDDSKGRSWHIKTQLSFQAGRIIW